MVKILTEPKNALLKQYKKLFTYDDIELEITDDALAEIAKKTLKQKTGARGLRSIIEGVLMDVKVESPLNAQINKIIVTADSVKNNASNS